MAGPLDSLQWSSPNPGQPYHTVLLKLSTSAAGEDDDGSWAARFAGWLTETYAARQTAAADKCGVAPGEAWRAALAAADACGAAQVCPPLSVF